MLNKTRAVRLLQQLVRIDSQNPPGDERRIAAFVADYFSSLGIRPKIYTFKKNRPNVIVSIKGRDSSHSLLITPHLDTVPAGRSWKHAPLSATIDGARIYGLGATDCKVNLACAMEAIRSIKADGVYLGYDLIFAATADEECGSDLGLIPLLNKGILKPSEAVVLDADDFEIIIAQKGLIHLTVKIQGRRAHGAYPERGINAIDIAMDIIKALKDQKRPFPLNKYLKPPTINVGVIKGGDKVNVVADWCEFELDFRFLPGQRAEDILNNLKNIIAKFSKKFKIEVQGIQQPYSIDARQDLVTSLLASGRRMKIPAVLAGSEGATVITFFQHKRIPAVAWGFGCGGCAHTNDEFVKIKDLWRGAQVLEDFLKHYR